MQARRLNPEPQPPLFDIYLRVRHPYLDPATISHELQLPAEHSYRAGEARDGRAGAAGASVHSESCWLASLQPASWPASSVGGGASGEQSRAGQINEALARDPGAALAMCTMFLRRHAAFLQQITREGGEIHLRIALDAASADGFTLAPQHMGLLSELAIALDIEFDER